MPGETPLHMMAMMGQAEAVQRLLDRSKYQTKTPETVVEVLEIPTVEGLRDADERSLNSVGPNARRGRCCTMALALSA
jgi:hypothetical protein